MNNKDGDAGGHLQQKERDGFQFSKILPFSTPVRRRAVAKHHRTLTGLIVRKTWISIGISE